MMYFWDVLPLLLAIPAQTLFLLLFSIKLFGAGEWWKAPVGRALFIKSIAITSVAVLMVCEFFYRVHHGGELSFGWDYSPAGLFLLGAYWIAVIAVYYQLIVLVRLRKEEQKIHVNEK